jgi:F-type H+/Na+-transporting ATPase subunit alpha
MIDAMDDVTGTLRLDLAQYFELQSFAQFGSDLDEATQQTLARGERTMNMLQQDEHDVIPVEEQVCLIYAVTNGLLDDIDADNVVDWQRQFREHLKNSHEDLLNNIRETQEFSDEDAETLKEAIENFNESYEPESGGVVEVGGAGEDEEDEEEEGEGNNEEEEG